jgi:hypothetical protein
MAHPGNHGGFGARLDRDALRSCDRAGSNRRGMVSDATGQAVGEISVISMKRQERHDSPVEIINVLGLGLVTASGVALLLFGEALRGSLGFEFGVGSYVAVDSTRCFVWAGMFTKSPGFISIIPSSNCNLAPPSRR